MAAADDSQERPASLKAGSQVQPATADAVRARIDDIGFGPFQLMVLIGAGGVLASEGAEVLVMGSVTTLLIQAWGISPLMRGLMVSIVFVGFCIGNLLSGGIGDRLGRRAAILIAYLLIGTMGIVTSLVNSPAQMLVFRFFVGLGCGIGFPSVYALMAEVCPANLRGVLFAATVGFMPLGELYASIGVLLFDPMLEGASDRDTWRQLIQFSAAPSFFFFVFTALFLHESPLYLLAKGRIEDVNLVMTAMAQQNGSSDAQTSFAAIPSSSSPDASPRTLQQKNGDSDGAMAVWISKMTRPFGQPYLPTTLMMFLAHFTKDFSVFGLNYVFPQYFKEMSGPMLVGTEMAVVSLLSFPGVLLGGFVTSVDSVGHIPCLSSAAGLCGIWSIGLLTIFPADFHGVCAYALKFLALTYFIITAAYTAEVFPTSIRSSAVGLCTGAGRTGSIAAPIFFELTRKTTDSFDPFWIAIMVLGLSVAVLSRCTLSLETKGKPLLDDADPDASARKHPHPGYSATDNA
mmetsp:Transcript_68524/g.164562  ORF Transcript_68524/g.164562 Transcript_68524/m.164562 type:complete len:516 (+) Transcript_68524:186-1733(+)